MKKLFCILIAALAALSLAFPAFAAEGSAVSGGTKITAGQTFTVTLQVTGVTDVKAVMATLSYDSAKLTRNSMSGTNGFSVETGTRIVADSSTAKSGTVAFATVSFTATSSFAEGETTTISLSNVQVASDSEQHGVSGGSLNVKVVSTNNNLSALSVNGNSVSGFSASTTSYNLGSTDASSITIAATASSASATVSGTGSKNLGYGKNTFNVVVTAESGAKKTYSIIVTRNDNRSTDSKLKSLSVSAGTLSFSASKTSYTVIVENSVTSVTVSAAANDPKASVSGAGRKNLAVYSNVFKVTVTAENGSKTVYSITVVRKDADGNLGKLSDNNNLKSLSVEGYEIGFSSDITEYSIAVDNTVSAVAVTAQVSDENASYEIIAPESFAVGENSVIIKVVSQSLIEKIYTIVVTRSADSPITDLEHLEQTLQKAASDTVILNIGEAGTVPAELLSALKNSGKFLEITRYSDAGLALYIWKLDGSNVSDSAPFDSGVAFASEYEQAIRGVTNYAEAMFVHFAHSGELPANTTIKIYVADRYADGELINLYSYEHESGKVTAVCEGLAVSGGYVEAPLEHCSDYFLSRARLKSGVDIYPIASIILAVLLLAVIVLYTLKLNKLKKLIPPQQEQAEAAEKE